MLVWIVVLLFLCLFAVSSLIIRWTLNGMQNIPDGSFSLSQPVYTNFLFIINFCPAVHHFLHISIDDINWEEYIEPKRPEEAKVHEWVCGVCASKIFQFIEQNINLPTFAIW